jgi:acid phosphatase type 7
VTNVETVGSNNHRKKLLLGVAGGLCIIATASLAFLQVRQPRYQTFTVSEDASVQSQAVATKANTLRVSNKDKTCSTTTDCSAATEVSYIKFQVKNFPANKRPSKVELRLFATNISADGGKVYRVSDNSWSEGTITWQNAPQIRDESLASFGPISQTGWKQVSLPPTSVPKNGEYTFAIRNDDKNTAAYFSKEAGKRAPELRVYFDDDSLTTMTSTEPRIILAAGDISCQEIYRDGAHDDCEHAKTEKIIADVQPHSVLMLGDIQYEYGELTFFNSQFKPTWGKHQPILKPAPGNHEYYNSYDNKTDGCASKEKGNIFAEACGYYDYFNGVGNVTGQAGERGKGYYAFNEGNWRIYAINSNCYHGDGCKAGSKQERWLRADMAEHPYSCKLMFMHHPILASDVRNFDAQLAGLPDLQSYLFTKKMLDELKDLYQAFNDYQGDLVLAGHSHYYERFAKQNIQFKPDGLGFRQIIVGTGGRYTYGFDEKNIRPNSEVRGPTRNKGLLKVNLASSGYKWEFLPTPDVAFTDKGSDTCNYKK